MTGHRKNPHLIITAYNIRISDLVDPKLLSSVPFSICVMNEKFNTKFLLISI